MSRRQTPTAFVALLLTSLSHTALAMPVSRLYRRDMSTGAKAGLGVGIAVAAVLVILMITFFAIHLRRSRHLARINQERAILAGEKNADGSDKVDKFAPEAPKAGGIPKRNKSVKDRLMGPMYRGSTIDLMPVPRAHTNGANRQSTMTLGDGDSFINKPWAKGDSSPRPSFSSKRATRMMMMM
ncbi:hypothetical protein PV08_05746 [Exophiala spinifera]|uniref:Uncharacterized protein n=1 Tax=Exophiala spinifera TaxID=91928 RepID=A0A0D1YKY8_9EURO|nr:uncharacterized protein PV08_05746 [Exophiala spinifera]KIW15696.1 hypothetical protein PV08_05746 [Exophiala spinifera]